MISRTVYVNGQQHLLGSLQPGRIFIGHKYFGDDAQRRNNYRLPFRDAFAVCGYEPLFPNDLALPGGLLWTLTQEILNAGASIFDVTGCNANVLIELGIALGMNLPVLTICEVSDATLPDFLNELAPLRYPSRAALKRTIVEELTHRIGAFASGRLNPRYCSVCKQECASRRSGLWSKDEYLVVGVSEEADEDFYWNLEETLRNFQPTVNEESVPESRQAICQWVERLQRAKIALFSLRVPHHGPETGAVYLQLGLAVGLGVPWTMILHEKEPAPVDLRGMTYVARGESDILFRTDLSNAIRGLLLENRVVIPDGGAPLPYVDELDDDDSRTDDNELAVNEVFEDDLDLQQVYQIPDDTWPIFTQQIRRALRLARDEAQRFNHNYIGTEHLLLGLTQELMNDNDEVAARVLSKLSVKLNTIRAATEFIIGRGDPISLGNGPTPRATKVIALTMDEARRLNHRHIGTEHLLLGLVREGEGIAAGVLESLSVNLERARSQTIEVLNGDVEGASHDPQEINEVRERFTERARKVLSLAHDEAQRFNHDYIGTEHLLLGLVREGEGVAAKVLISLGVELQKVRSAVEFIIGRGDRIVLREIRLSDRATKVIRLAVDEAGHLNHNYIDTGHLLLALVREGEGIGAGILESFGVNPVRVLSRTERVLKGEPL